MKKLFDDVGATSLRDKVATFYILICMFIGLYQTVKVVMLGIFKASVWIVDKLSERHKKRKYTQINFELDDEDY